MAEPPPKRRRDDDGDTQIEPTKRHRNPYINDQQEATQDLLDFLINLSSDPFLDFPQHPEPDPDDNNNNNNNNDNNHPTSNTKEEVIDEDDEKEKVIRHLLEASDDELGIPSRVDDGGDGGGGGEVAGGGYGDFPVDLCYGLWEIEDEAANYYTLLQSELFMQ